MKADYKAIKGDIVEIHNFTASGQKVSEGKAKMLKKKILNGLEWWEVEFIDEPGQTFLRRIF